MRAMGLSFGFAPLLALTTIGVLVLVIPGVPSSAGTFEAGLVFGLRALGVDEGASLSAALLYHAVQVLPETLIGLVVLRARSTTARATAQIALAETAREPTA
jgi:uncharacterized membrane protein YbhN (UPF0104 family)